MKKKAKILAILVWFGFILFLLIGLELFIRRRQGYLVWEFKLVKSKFYELDRMRIWNKKAYKKNPAYFKEWPIPLEFFESDSPYPYYLYKPNLRMANKNNRLVPAKEGDEVYYFINSFGLKSSEISLKKSPETTRIVALGASTTEGSSSNENAYPSQLEQILINRDFKVEVINAGHGGYRVDDILAFYRMKILPLKPDILIFYEGSINNVKFSEWLKD